MAVNFTSRPPRRRQVPVRPRLSQRVLRVISLDAKSNVLRFSEPSALCINTTHRPGSKGTEDGAAHSSTPAAVYKNQVFSPGSQRSQAYPRTPGPWSTRPTAQNTLLKDLFSRPLAQRLAPCSHSLGNFLMPSCRNSWVQEPEKPGSEDTWAPVPTLQSL